MGTLSAALSAHTSGTVTAHFGHGDRMFLAGRADVSGRATEGNGESRGDGTEWVRAVAKASVFAVTSALVRAIWRRGREPWYGE